MKKSILIGFVIAILLFSLSLLAACDPKQTPEPQTPGNSETQTPDPKTPEDSGKEDEGNTDNNDNEAEWQEGWND